MEQIDVTQEMLEQALLCCANDNPAPTGMNPCEDCYLMQKNLVKDGHMSTGQTCFMHLALDAISHIRRIKGDAKMWETLRHDSERIRDSLTTENTRLVGRIVKLESENAQLRAVVEQIEPDFFTRKCRSCGCDWNHPCEDGCSWVGDDLCSKCLRKKLRGETNG